MKDLIKYWKGYIGCLQRQRNNYVDGCPLPRSQMNKEMKEKGMFEPTFPGFMNYLVKLHKNEQRTHTKM